MYVLRYRMPLGFVVLQDKFKIFPEQNPDGILKRCGTSKLERRKRRVIQGFREGTKSGDILAALRNHPHHPTLVLKKSELKRLAYSQIQVRRQRKLFPSGSFKNPPLS